MEQTRQTVSPSQRNRRTEPSSAASSTRRTFIAPPVHSAPTSPARYEAGSGLPKSKYTDTPASGPVRSAARNSSVRHSRTGPAEPTASISRLPGVEKASLPVAALRSAQRP